MDTEGPRCDQISLQEGHFDGSMKKEGGGGISPSGGYSDETMGRVRAVTVCRGQSEGSERHLEG